MYENLGRDALMCLSWLCDVEELVRLWRVGSRMDWRRVAIPHVLSMSSPSWTDSIEILQW